MDKIEIYKELFRHHHILHFNKKLVVTNKFHRDFSLEEMSKEAVNTTVGVQQTNKPVPTLIEEKAVSILPSSAQNFKQFIMDSEVPEKLYLSNGNHYWANRYNAKADKEFRRIMKNPEIQYTVLVASTKLYYKAGGARETISNYILNGTWESFYDDMVNSLEKGTTEEHIKKNLRDGDEGYSRYK